MRLKYKERVKIRVQPSLIIESYVDHVLHDRDYTPTRAYCMNMYMRQSLFVITPTRMTKPQELIFTSNIKIKGSMVLVYPMRPGAVRV